MAYPLPAGLTVLTALMLGAAPVMAQQSHPSDWNRPYGQAPGSETRPYQGARTAGNRVVINGIIQTGVGVSAQASAYANASASVGLNGGIGEGSAYGPFASANAFAVGNQLNVVVNGNYNTVVINSRQINNGNVTANADARADDESDSQSNGGDQ